MDHEVVEHAFNPSTRELGAGLVYRGSSRAARGYMEKTLPQKTKNKQYSPAHPLTVIRYKKQ